MQLGKKETDLLACCLSLRSSVFLSAEFLSAAYIWNLTQYIEVDEISLGLSVLGLTGITAWAGLVDILRPAKGQNETIFVSAASGAVGQIVGQIAKKVRMALTLSLTETRVGVSSERDNHICNISQVYGLTTIGSCGGPEKCAIAKEKFCYDHAIDYKTAPTTEALVAELKKAAPDGIDMYFENVGNEHFGESHLCYLLDNVSRMCDHYTRFCCSDSDRLFLPSLLCFHSPYMLTDSHLLL